MRKTRILKRLVATIFALTLVLSGVVPGVPPIMVQAANYGSEGIHVGDVFESGDTIIFDSEMTLYVNDEAGMEYMATDIWTNVSGTTYYAESVSDSEIHLVDLPEIDHFVLCVWLDDWGKFGTEIDACNPIDVGSKSSMTVEEALQAIHNNYSYDITIKDNKLYKDRSLTDYYSGTLDLSTGEVSYSNGSFEKRFSVYTIFGVDHLFSTEDKETVDKEEKKEKQEGNEPKEIVIIKTPETHYGTFQEDAINRVQTAIANINKATTNGTTNQTKKVELNTGVWVSFHKSVYEEIQKCTVPVSITFIYQGTRYVVTIPANADVLSLVDENGFCGFLNLGAHYGYDSIEKLW